MLAKTDVRILKRFLKHGPLNAYQLRKTRIPPSTVFRKLPSLKKRGYLELVREEMFGTKIVSKYYDLSVKAFMSLSLADPKYILDKLGDFHDFFLRHGIDYSPDALKGMFKIWIYYGQRLPRIDGKLPYFSTEDPHLEFLSNVNRGILSIALSRVNPLAGAGETPWLVPPTLVTPGSLRVALMSSLTQTEAEAVLTVMYKNEAPLNNTDMALVGEAQFKMIYGKEEPKEYMLRGYLPRKGHMFKVVVRLNSNILEDDLPADEYRHLDINDIKEVKAKRIPSMDRQAGQT